MVPLIFHLTSDIHIENDFILIRAVDHSDGYSTWDARDCSP